MRRYILCLIAILALALPGVASAATLPSSGDFSGNTTTKCTGPVDDGTVSIVMAPPATGHALLLQSGCTGHIHEVDITNDVGDPIHVGQATNLTVDILNIHCYAPNVSGFHQDGIQVLGGADNVQFLGGYVGCYSANNSQAMFHTAGGTQAPPNNVVFHHIEFDPAGTKDPTLGGCAMTDPAPLACVAVAQQLGHDIPPHGLGYWCAGQAAGSGTCGAYGLSNGESTYSGFDCVALDSRSNDHDLFQGTAAVNPIWTFSSVPTGVVDNFGGAYTMCQPPDTTAPSTPANLRISDDSQANSLPVAWDASTDDTGVVGYHVTLTPLGGSAVAEPDTSSPTDTFPVSWGSYTITVSAYDAAGNVSAPATLAVKSAWQAN